MAHNRQSILFTRLQVLNHANHHYLTKHTIFLGQTSCRHLHNSNLQMDAIEQLLDWARSKGVKLNGIAPNRMPGRGIGLVSTREIKPGEVVLEIPLDCLRTLDTVPKSLVRRLPPRISVHGLLAADLALDNNTWSQHRAAWNAVCPKPDELSTVPLVWPRELQDLLPPAARELFGKQKVKYAKDWAEVRPVMEAAAAAASGSIQSTGQSDSTQAVPSGPRETSDDALEVRYRHAWLLVNTRTFYYTNARLKKRARHDHLALQPVADLFNHTDDDGSGETTGEGAACSVTSDYRGFRFTATRAYVAAGEEVHICYGRHGSDKLLVEYGFAMNGNRWDEVSLDEVLLAKLDDTQWAVLEEAGFLGKYVLDRDGVCHRTQVAARQLCGCKPEEWRRFVNGADDGEASQGKVDKVLLEMLREYLQMAVRAMEQIAGLGVGSQEQRDMLAARWRQIQEMLRPHIERLECCAVRV
ncbi:protein-histidine N-methyltransferase [Microdochium nivale]|nr:protein-histidine N-methyltransferase [Microdochium nivale]